MFCVNKNTPNGFAKYGRTRAVCVLIKCILFNTINCAIAYDWNGINNPEIMYKKTNVFPLKCNFAIAKAAIVVNKIPTPTIKKETFVTIPKKSQKIKCLEYMYIIFPTPLRWKKRWWKIKRIFWKTERCCKCPKERNQKHYSKQNQH